MILGGTGSPKLSPTYPRAILPTYPRPLHHSFSTFLYAPRINTLTYPRPITLNYEQPTLDFPPGLVRSRGTPLGSRVGIFPPPQRVTQPAAPLNKNSAFTYPKLCWGPRPGQLCLPRLYSEGSSGCCTPGLARVPLFAFRKIHLYGKTKKSTHNYTTANYLPTYLP